MMTAYRLLPGDFGKAGRCHFKANNRHCAITVLKENKAKGASSKYKVIILLFSSKKKNLLFL